MLLFYYNKRWSFFEMGDLTFVLDGDSRKGRLLSALRDRDLGKCKNLSKGRSTVLQCWGVPAEMRA